MTDEERMVAREQMAYWVGTGWLPDQCLGALGRDLGGDQALAARWAHVEAEIIRAWRKLSPPG